MFKVFVFIYRLFLFIISYLFYCLSVLLIFLNMKKISKNIFIFSAYLCSRSLGVKFNIDKKSKTYLLKKGIHTANHDSPLDIFIAQCVFRIPTITTVDNHLNKILPFFKLSLNNFGHYSFDYLNINQRKLAYNFLVRKSNQEKKILIFPSGSIYTSIKKRFSRSIAKLSKKNNLDVIAWKIALEEKDTKLIKYEENLFRFLFQRFLSVGTTFFIEDLCIFRHEMYSNEDDMHDCLCKFYIE